MRGRRRHIIAFFSFLACTPLTTGEARGDDAPTAEQLFDRARKLLEKTSTLDEACRTFEQSLKLAERGDTLLNLAECHRRQGKTATAWAEFDRALAVGKQVGFGEAVQAATRLRDYLAARLSRITLTVSPETAALPELAITVNGTAWPRAQWNTPQPYDPGNVAVAATAKGYKPFSAQVTLGAEKDQRSIVVTLEAEAPAPPAPPPRPPAGPVRGPMPVWPWIVGVAGLAMGGAAVGFELDSRSAGSTLDQHCGTTRKNCPPGYNFAPVRARELRGYDLFVGLGAGGILAVGVAGLGLGLWARGPAPPKSSLLLSPTSIGFASSF